MKKLPTDDPKQKKKASESYVFDITDALSSPILTYSASWADMLPKRLLDIIPMAKMKALMSGEDMATYAECAVYLYTRSLEAPMDSEWVDIYTHVSCQTLSEWFKEDHFETVKAPKKLSEWLESQLNKLRRDIYHKRRELLRKELRGRKPAG